MRAKFVLFLSLSSLVLFASSSGQAGDGVTYVLVPYEVRSMTLTYAKADEGSEGLVNDYQLFGIVKDAIENTWKARSRDIEISNGLTFNSGSTTSGDLDSSEYDIGIFVQTKKRVGKLLYIFNSECSTAGGSIETIQFDLIEENRFYSEMKRLAVQLAESCPKK
jgi:hypothetical protein